MWSSLKWWGCCEFPWLDFHGSFAAMRARGAAAGLLLIASLVPSVGGRGKSLILLASMTRAGAKTGAGRTVLSRRRDRRARHCHGQAVAVTPVCGPRCRATGE